MKAIITVLGLALASCSGGRGSHGTFDAQESVPLAMDAGADAAPVADTLPADAASSDAQTPASDVLRGDAGPGDVGASDVSDPCAGGCPIEIAIGPVPGGDWVAFQAYFQKHVDVFGVHIFATDAVGDDKLLHAAHVMAQYLDNDENGEPDNPAVLSAMTDPPAASCLVMFGTEGELESSGVFESNLPEFCSVQDLYASETHPDGSSPQGGFDATLEEVLHLVTSQGYSTAHPAAFAEAPGSAIGDAMDIARGGQFFSVPASYPDEAWYHYDDFTCDYGCMVTEYFYWALTSMLGAQNYPGRCEDITHEWELCTREWVESTDTAIFALLTDPRYKLPTVLPDGSYGQ